MTRVAMFVAVVACICATVHAAPVAHLGKVLALKQMAADHAGNEVTISFASSSSSDQCLFDADCNHGKCELVQTQANPNGTRSCVCNSRYTTFKDTGVCMYERKSQWVAFLLAFFVGEFGAHDFYLARGSPDYEARGAMKIVMLFFGVFTVCVFFCASDNNDRSCLVGLFIVLTILGLACVSIWWIVDWAMLAAGARNDGNGVALFNGF